MILRFIAYFAGFLVMFVALLALLVFIVDRSIRSKGYDGPISDHFNGTKFLNIKDAPVVEASKSPEQHSWRGSVFKWMLSRDSNVWEKRPVTQTKPAARVEGAHITATFINHATVLIQTQGLNIITDPIYSKRASPFSFLGPERYTNPGVAFDDLPTIDAVLISHNHYDHFDIATLKKLVARDHPAIIVPLGNKEYAESRGITGVTELDWWQSQTVAEGVSIECVPAQHFSARSISDRNTTLWSGYVISAPAGAIYFAGDTGNGPFIDRIAEHYPNGFALGLLPIGAFRPEWFMKEVHISPSEAFAIQQKLHIKDAIGIHFGTFKLADDKQDEPPQRIRELTEATSTPNQFHILPNGGNLTL